MVFFLLMQFVWKYVDDLVGKGVEWYYILELLIYISATVVPMALPLAVLLSSLMTLGAFGEHNELAAMRSSGVSLLRLFRVLVVFSSLVAIGSYLFADNVIPVAQFKSKSLLRNITKKKPALNIRPGIFYNGIEGYSIKISDKTGPENNELKNIIIYDHTSNMGNVKVTTAQEGLMELTPDNRFMVITLQDGQSYEEHFPSNREDREKKPFSTAQFERAIIRFSLEDFESGDLRQETNKDFNMLNNNQLIEAKDSLNHKLSNTKMEFSKTMLDRFGFTSPNNRSDSLGPLKPEILENFDPLRRKMAIENAMRIARSNRSYYEQRNVEFRWRHRHITRHMIEWHKKYALAFACFMMLFVGAPLGAIIRKGGMGMPLVISVVIFIFYYVMSFTFEKLGRELVWHPLPAMWIANFVFFPIGLLLTYKTANDAEFMGMEFWVKIWKKIIKPLKRKS